MHLSATSNFWILCGSLKVLWATQQDCLTKIQGRTAAATPKTKFSLCFLCYFWRTQGCYNSVSPSPQKGHGKVLKKRALSGKVSAPATCKEGTFKRAATCKVGTSKPASLTLLQSYFFYLSFPFTNPLELPAF